MVTAQAKSLLYVFSMGQFSPAVLEARTEALARRAARELDLCGKAQK